MFHSIIVFLSFTSPCTDEATSALDTTSEREVQASIDRLLSKKKSATATLHGHSESDRSIVSNVNMEREESRDIQQHSLKIESDEESTESSFTAIIVAHRLSTIQNADKIIVLKDGQIIEEGPHATLVSIHNGEYSNLWEMQALSSIIKDKEDSGTDLEADTSLASHTATEDTQGGRNVRSRALNDSVRTETESVSKTSVEDGKAGETGSIGQSHDGIGGSGMRINAPKIPEQSDMPLGNQEKSVEMTQVQRKRRSFYEALEKEKIPKPKLLPILIAFQGPEFFYILIALFAAAVSGSIFPVVRTSIHVSYLYNPKVNFEKKLYTDSPNNGTNFYNAVFYCIFGCDYHILRTQRRHLQLAFKLVHGHVFPARRGCVSRWMDADVPVQSLGRAFDQAHSTSHLPVSYQTTRILL